MKITCSKSDLVAAVSNVSRAVSSKSSIPALEGVLVKAYGEKLNISGYNLEIGITTDIDASIIKEGEIVIGAKLFLDIVRRLPEEVVTIETDDRMVTYITCGQADYKIMGMSSVEYPDLPSFEQTDSITLNSKVLRDMIRQTVYAVSDNMAKPIYTGSLFEISNSTLTIVAIDGYRMAIRKESVDSQSENSFVVPGKTQLEILKLLTEDDEPVDIIIGQRHITFKVKSYRVISRLIEGSFIDYKATVSKEEKTVLVISTRKLIESVERMSLLNNERMQSPVRCKFLDNEIRLSCASAVGSAKDVIDVDIAGESLEIVVSINGFTEFSPSDDLSINITAAEVDKTFNVSADGEITSVVIPKNQTNIVVSATTLNITTTANNLTILPS